LTVSWPGQGQGWPTQLGKVGWVILTRLATAAVLVLVATLATFLLLRLAPGNAVLATLPSDATPEQVAEARVRLGVDEPVLVQYGSYIGHLVRGDMGRSYVNDIPVTTLIATALPVTISLAIVAILIAIPIALVLGVTSGAREGSRADGAITGWNSLMVATPQFFLGIILMLIFAVQLGWLPAIGFVALTSDPLGFIEHITLPGLTVGATLAAPLARQLRGSMTGVLAQDYITAAEARGVPWRTVLWKNALKNAAIPPVTLFGLQLIYLVGGQAIIEQLFGLPGLGMLAISAAFNRDLPVIQGIVVVAALVAITISMLVDVVYRLLDPRIRSG
jgi:peptide/nickel transport system permease protein